MLLKKLSNTQISIKTLEKMKWFALGVLLLYFFMTSLYPDIVITYNHSLNFLDCVFSGNFLEFYEYTLERIFLGFPADYYIIIYIIFGIWSFPIWILTKICNIDPYSIVAMLWVRTLVVVFVLGTFQIIHKIFEELLEKEDEHIYFMISSSLLLVLPSLVMGQYDVISLFFMLWGVLLCLKEDGISWKTLILFTIAIPIKTLAVFPVALIILHKEKRIFAIIKNLFVSMIGLFLCIIPFMNNAGYQEAMTYNGGWINKISRARIPSAWDQGISLFWLCFFGLCIIAYKMRNKGKKEYLHQITWLLTAFYVLFFGFTPAHPQWCVLIVPFMMLLIRNKDQNYILNILLEMAASVSMMLLQAYYYGWVYFTNITSFLLLKNVGKGWNLKGIDSMREIYDKVLPPELVAILHAAYLVTSVAIVIINNPWCEARTLGETEKKQLPVEVLKLDWLRILIILGYILVTLFIVYVI